MSKFKVGDTVKVTKRFTSDDEPYVGNNYEINEVDEDDDYLLKGVDNDLCMVESQLELVKTKGFTKADMQLGQPYKVRNGNMMFWEKSEPSYNDNLEWSFGKQYDVVEVYLLKTTPIWKREEPKYRVKTELTKEQAEKLGLEFCEEVTDGTL